VASLTYVSSELFDHTLNITMSIKISHWFFDHCLNPSRLHLVSKSILSKRFGTYFLLIHVHLMRCIYFQWQISVLWR